ncbi:hypothetical protein Gohar_013027 [Gossypium harknessii]|uniref:Uncharacterized protein n=2 Tax=Gossypium TaxID=3633 RepID=A0A7J8ZUC3_9ROSI|nr:hypothetical protein [Gossypium laxum]MBA0802754.1 hypothetical protein [Gossypium harknessii]
MLPLVPSIFLHFIFIFFVVVHGSKNDSIYEILKLHGLPTGLLPKGITRFEYDDTGRFEVHLDQACNAKFESEFHYDINVSGTLSYGKIMELSGILAQDLFLWFPVKGIWVDVPSSGLIHFDILFVYKQYPLSFFETPKDCLAISNSESGDSIRDGKLLAEAISKVQFAVNLRYLDMNPVKKILGGTRCRKVDKTSCAIAQSVYIQAHFGGPFPPPL